MPSYRFRRYNRRRSRRLFGLGRRRYGFRRLRTRRLRRGRLRNYPRPVRKYIRPGLSPELKSAYAYPLSATASTTWSASFLNALNQDQTSTTRIGAQAKMKKLLMRWEFFNGITNAYDSVSFRVIIGMCPTHIATSALVITNVLDDNKTGTVNLNALRYLGETHEFIVLRDFIVTTAPDLPNKHILLNIPLNFLTRWNNVAPGFPVDFDYGIIWMFVAANTTNANAGYRYAYRLSFYDS